MKVVVAMSGGVDSSTTAALLVEQGHDVVGVHMRLHDRGPATAQPGTCCGLDDALDARLVADRLGIPFYVVDLQEAFRKGVMDPFVDAYASGATPNPCVLCNGVLKFRVLLGRALALGATHLATGHYARLGEGPTLRTAVDADKDQTYFLFPIAPATLSRLLFPLGDLTKAEVRAHARRLGLDTADKAESQDVCFLPDGDHARLVREARPELEGAGDIVDEQGRVLGRHDGWFRYTVGQRRGLGVAAAEPLYVLRVEPETRRVVLAPDARLHRAGLVAGGCTWFERPAPDRVVGVRIRHRGAIVPCTVHADDAGGATVRFDGTARAVTPGQAAVFYDGDRVLGGGWIRRATEA